MAITFLKERKRQKYLLWVLLTLLFVALIIILYGFLNKRNHIFLTKKSVHSLPVIKINFNVLKDPKLQKLHSFKEIPLEKEGENGNKKIKIGRENPFIPFATGTSNIK